MSVVEELRDGDELLGFAIAPDGRIHHPVPLPYVRRRCFNFELRKADAQEAADNVVTALTRHRDCGGCDPWEDWPDRASARG